MSVVLDREMEHLREMLLYQKVMVEDAYSKAVSALMNQDMELSRKVIEGDEELDMMEIKVEEECLRVLNLHQPVATDLRFIVAVLKINNDLERMGDTAVKIAKRAQFFTIHQDIELPIDLSLMAERVKSMVQRSLSSFVDSNAELAYQVTQDDDDVDEMRTQFTEIIKDLMRKKPEQYEFLLELTTLVRHFERLADMATSIAEEVIYFVEGKIIRHQF